MSATSCAPWYNWNQVASKLKTLHIHWKQSTKIIIATSEFNHFTLLNTRPFLNVNIRLVAPHDPALIHQLIYSSTSLEMKCHCSKFLNPDVRRI